VSSGASYGLAGRNELCQPNGETTGELVYDLGAELSAWPGVAELPVSGLQRAAAGAVSQLEEGDGRVVRVERLDDGGLHGRRQRHGRAAACESVGDDFGSIHRVACSAFQHGCQEVACVVGGEGAGPRLSVLYYTARGRPRVDQSGSVFAPDYTPEEISAIAEKLPVQAGLPKQPSGEVANGARRAKPRAASPKPNGRPKKPTKAAAK